MAGERLTVEIGQGGPHLEVDVQGNLGAQGWRGTAVDAGPAERFGPGPATIYVLEPASHRDMRADVDVEAQAGSIVLVGRTGLAW